MIRSYQDLEVWQRAMDLVVQVYILTSEFPPDERFGLVTQMRRAAVSIPSNIAEGYARRERRDYARFISMAYGSGAELETQLKIAKQLNFSSTEKYINVEELLTQVQKMLNSLAEKLRQPPLIPSP